MSREFDKVGQEVVFSIPMDFRRVEILNGSESALRKLVQGYDGKVVLFRDEGSRDNGYMLARIRVDDGDSHFFQAQTPYQGDTLNPAMTRYDDVVALMEGHGDFCLEVSCRID